MITANVKILPQESSKLTAVRFFNGFWAAPLLWEKDSGSGFDVRIYPIGQIVELKPGEATDVTIRFLDPEAEAAACPGRVFWVWQGRVVARGTIKSSG